MDKSKSVRLTSLVATALSMIGLRKTDSVNEDSDDRGAADAGSLHSDSSEYKTSRTVTNPSVTRGGFGLTGGGGGG